MKREIIIDGKAIPMEVSGDTPRAYREEFGEDVFVALSKLNLKALDMGVIEKLAYIMAKALNGEIGPLNEWLKTFESPYSFYNASVDIINLWTASTKTTSKTQKK